MHLPPNMIFMGIVLLASSFSRPAAAMSLGPYNSDSEEDWHPELIRQLQRLGHDPDGTVQDWALPYLPEDLVDRVLQGCNCAAGAAGANVKQGPSGTCVRCYPYYGIP